MGLRVSRRLVVLSLGVVLLGASWLPAFASNLQQRLDQTRQQEAQTRQNITAKKQEADLYSGQIQALDQQIAAKDRQLQDINNQLQETQHKVDETTRQLQAAQAKLAQDTALLGNRLKGIYVNGSLSYLDIILSSKDFSDFITRYELLRRIIDQDKAVIAAVSAEKTAVAQRQAELLREKNQLLALEKQQQAARRALATSRSMKEERLAAAQQDVKAYKQQLDRLEAEEQAIIRQVLAEQQATGVPVQGSGVFTWPVPGYADITSPFGWRYHPILHENRFHDGIDIGASEGASIVAADNGVVIYAGWMSGYGNTVMIKHTNSLTTLYGHMSAILVSNGQTVRKGQPVGRVGSTGLSTGPHLHFGVLLNGQWVNPMNYLR